MPTLRRTLALSLAVVALTSGCRRKPAAQTAPTPAGGPSSPAATTPPAPTPTPTPAPAPAGADNAAITAARASLEGAIYFEYDQDQLTEQARGQLDQKLAVLVANAGVAIRITGHADDRGSDEYNLALGQRRAATIKRYFSDRGVADARVDVVSMGEEQPECMASEENCWQRNRRATFVITSGTISAPGRR